MTEAANRELAELTSELIKLGAMVLETVPRGTEILLSGELQQIQQLIDDDAAIDQLAHEIEERCHAYMVLQAPKAGQLRLLVTAMKLVAELERSADLMVNVCKAARRMYGSTMSPKVRGLAAAMAKEAAKLLRLSIDAFADSNEALAAALDDIDDELDQLNRDMVLAIFEAHNDGLIDLQAAVQLALVARYYERIGDHAVNIGNRVMYMVTGWLPDHAATPEIVESKEIIAEVEADGNDVPDAKDARIRQALSAVPLGIVIGDADGEVLFENDFMADFASGRHSDALVQAAVSDLMAQARSGQQGQRSLDVYGPPRRFLELWSTPILEGSLSSDSMVVVEDVTEDRRIEDVRKDFVANVSHELKTPVGAISLLAETLNDAVDPKVIERLSSRLQSEVFRLGNTIDDLLTLSQLESGEAPVYTQILVVGVISGVIDRSASAAERRQIELVVEGLEDDTGLMVRGDHAQLVSALGNLVDNAVTYSDVGSTVTIRVETAEERLSLLVCDTGIGIPESDQERIFERFYRVDPARSRATGGTGLGLSIVRHIMRNHNGAATVESREGQGSTFRLRFDDRENSA